MIIARSISYYTLFSFTLEEIKLLMSSQYKYNLKSILAKFYEIRKKFPTKILKIADSELYRMCVYLPLSQINTQ